jgi:hypothetical protein
VAAKQVFGRQYFIGGGRVRHAYRTPYSAVKTGDDRLALTSYR